MPLDDRNSDLSATTFVPELHRRLALFNHWRASPNADGLDWLAALQAEYRMRRLEYDYIESESAMVRPHAASAPNEPDRFIAWLDGVLQLGVGRDESWLPYLENDASLEQLQWYLRQESAAEAGFGELTALTQLHFAPRVKSDKCRIGFEEPDSGAAASAKRLLLDRLGRVLAIAQQETELVLPSLARSNLLVALAANRRYAYRSAGALAATEWIARQRRLHVQRGFERCGIQGDSARFEAEASCAWSAEILRALVADEPAAASAIAEGALLRLAADARCISRYRVELSRVPVDLAQIPAALQSAAPPQADYVMAS